LDERPWAEWGRQRKPLSVNQLASLLRPFDIRPKNLNEGEGRPKGYTRKTFDDAWARYLPSPPLPQDSSATPLPSSNGAGESGFFDPLRPDTRSATPLPSSNGVAFSIFDPLPSSNGASVADRNSRPPTPNNESSGVADRAEK